MPAPPRRDGERAMPEFGCSGSSMGRIPAVNQEFRRLVEMNAGRGEVVLAAARVNIVFLCLLLPWLLDDILPRALGYAHYRLHVIRGGTVLLQRLLQVPGEGI